jgi:hypothetical protein
MDRGGKYSELYPIGTVQVQGNGYARIKTANGWKPQHRVVMEERLGRPLVSGENVHHLNGIRHDNRDENLELWWAAQPYGQRVSDLLEYVRTYHKEAV